MTSNFLARLAAPVALVAAILVAGPAHAASRRAQAEIDTIAARMSAAEARYRESVVRIADADPEARAQADAALADMEDAMAACTRTEGCPVSTLLASYARLLKEAADGEAAFAGGDGIDPDDADPDHAGADAASQPSPGDAGLLAAEVPEAARAASLLDSKSHRFDDMVQYNPAVQAAIRRWLTDMRGQLLDTHENYEYLRQLMWPSFQRAGLPEALLFGIMAKESNGKVHAGSRVGAAGPMQFMYATGKRFGLGVDATGFDTRYDPLASAQASAAYLNERMAELNDNIELALAAYNGGEGRARRVFQASGGRSFWDASVYAQFPPETRDYVPMVIAAAWLYLHPKRYGLSFRDVDARAAPLVLQKPDSLYGLTICLGDYGTRDGYLRTLRNLNPRLQADATLPAGTQLQASARIAGLYSRYCVRGPREELAQVLMQSDARAAVVRTAPDAPSALPPALAAKSPARPKHYQVQRGETLSSIARKFQCTPGQLAKSNRIKAPAYRIQPGQRLKLDACKQQ
jgi:membrane-bound lytic murein transglycosylase D